MERQFFVDNRKKLMSKVPDNVAVFLFAGKNRQMSADTDFKFLPDRNFYYLTGIDEPGAILVLIKRNNDDYEETLYIASHTALEDRWRGKVISASQAAEISGVDEIRDIKLFESEAYAIIQDNTFRIASDGSSIMETPRLFAQNVGAVRGDECLVDIKNELISMRMIKMPCEIEAIRKAARITEEAFRATKQLIKPGVSELELYSRIEYEMSIRGSLIPAFETIVANEGNSFCLHHPKPDLSKAGIVRDNGYVQFDVGARFDGYCADISRVCFVEELTPAQEKVLELVQDLRKRAFGFIRPGVTFDELNKELSDAVTSWLLNQDLGRNEGKSNSSNINCNSKSKSSPIEASSYVWHGTSHHLGLDVHDVGPRTSPFEAGNCLAVEPGVYIPEWGVGFRIEDDVVVTETGVELLSSGEDSKLSCIC